MDLTAWQRICNRILGGVVRKRARAQGIVQKPRQRVHADEA